MGSCNGTRQLRLSTTIYQGWFIHDVAICSPRILHSGLTVLYVKHLRSKQV